MLRKCHNCKRRQVLRNPCNSVFIVVQGELWTRFKGHSKGGSAGPAGWQHPATLEIAPIPSPAGKMPPEEKGVFMHNREVSHPRIAEVSPRYGS